jgi:hypothetical protein
MLMKVICRMRIGFKLRVQISGIGRPRAFFCLQGFMSNLPVMLRLTELEERKLFRQSHRRMKEAN